MESIIGDPARAQRDAHLSRPGNLQPGISLGGRGGGGGVGVGLVGNGQGTRGWGQGGGGGRGQSAGRLTYGQYL